MSEPTTRSPAQRFLDRFPDLPYHTRKRREKELDAMLAEARADALARLTPALHEWLCGSGAYPKHPSKRPAIGWPCERSAAAVRAILAEQKS